MTTDLAKKLNYNFTLKGYNFITMGTNFDNVEPLGKEVVQCSKVKDGRQYPNIY